MRKGSIVRLRKYENYDLTKTEDAYSYTDTMRRLAESGAKMKLAAQWGSKVYLEDPDGDMWTFHKDDVIFNMSFVNK